MPGVLISIQQAVVDMIAADPWIQSQGLAEYIIPEYPSDVDTMVDNALGARGLAFLVATPVARVIKQQFTKGPFLNVRIMIMGFEQVVLNQSVNGTRIHDALEVIANIVHLSLTENIHEAITAEQEFMNPVQRGNRYGIATNFSVNAGVGRVRPQWAAPGIADNGSGTITITSGVPGGGVFYTVNGKDPVPDPNNVNGLLYTTPFAIASGVTVKAKTWLAGKLASPVTTYQRP